MQIERHLERDLFEKVLWEIAIATLERGGVTFDLLTTSFLAPIDAWGLPRYPERTLILPPDACIAEGLRHFIQQNSSHLYAPEVWLGTWIHPQTNCCHLDITEIYPTLEEAQRIAHSRSLGRQQKILALYNFKHQRTLFLRHEQERVAPHI